MSGAPSGGRPTNDGAARRAWPLIVAVAVLLLGLAVMALQAVSPGTTGGARAPVPVASSIATEPSTPSAEITAPPAPAPAPEAAREVTQPAAVGIVIAWQPSHQGDTGANGWQEYVICGDIVNRAIALLPEYEHVKAWETGMGLTGSNNYRPSPSNVEAFDSEMAQANGAGADVFISIHNDGGAPSGILGEYLPGDAVGKALCDTLVAALIDGTGLPDRGMREVRLYSLEDEQNKAQRKCLLEIGDNAADRAYLENPANRQTIALALAAGVRAADLGR